MKREEVIAERYGLALTRIREIPDESICKETYRDYFMRWWRTGRSDRWEWRS